MPTKTTNMNLLESTFLKSTTCFSINKEGKQTPHFKTIKVFLTYTEDGIEKIKYWFIIRSERLNNVNHYIQSNDAPLNRYAWQKEVTTTKIYDTDAAFENAVKRIQRIINKQPVENIKVEF